MKLRSERAIKVEYTKIKNILRRKPLKYPMCKSDEDALYGAQQVLAWAFDENAMAASKCFDSREKK